MIDFHCHLDLYPQPSEVIARCEAERLYVLSVTTVPSAFNGTEALAPPNSRIRTALGLHPELAASRSRELPLFEALLPRTRYVGEVGLDGSKPHRATLEQQKGVLNDVLGMCAASGGRIISLHSRGATGLILDLLSARPEAGKFVLHWYLGSKRQIERASELGCWFSVNPAMFLSENGRMAIAVMPQDRILPESDGPFGTIDGQVASPWHSWLVVKSLENYWRISSKAVKTQLLETFRALVSGEAGHCE